jgi:hypothetical protein
MQVKKKNLVLFSHSLNHNCRGKYIKGTHNNSRTNIKEKTVATHETHNMNDVQKGQDKEYVQISAAEKQMRWTESPYFKLRNTVWQFCQRTLPQ